MTPYRDQSQVLGVHLVRCPRCRSLGTVLQDGQFWFPRAQWRCPTCRAVFAREQLKVEE